MLGRVKCYVGKPGVFLVTAALIAGLAGCTSTYIPPPPPSQNLEIRDWYDLDDIRDNLAGNHTLMNDLNSTTAGYTELASSTANGGRGWEPIGTFETDVSFTAFAGSFDGQGHEIHDLFINRHEEYAVGLFGSVEGGVVKNIGVVHSTVIGEINVGGLVGANTGTLTDSYSSGIVSGNTCVGGLVGANNYGTVTKSHSSSVVTGDGRVGGMVGMNQGAVSNSYSTSTVIGQRFVGGLVGWNVDGTVSNSHSSGNVTGSQEVGGLVGENSIRNTVSNSYSTGTVTGDHNVGGLVGSNGGIVSNSHYNYDEALVSGKNMITIGALFDEDFNEWLANGQFLDVDERLSQEDGYYLLSSLTDFKELLAFSQNSSLKFRLKSDLDLATEPNFFIPYLAGELDGDGHKISNLSLNSDSTSPLGLVGRLTPGAKVTQMGVENVTITGDAYVGGLVGWNDDGTVTNSHSIGEVTGANRVGGLVGWNYEGTLGNSYSSATVTGEWEVGGLVGWNHYATIGNSYASGNVSGNREVGGLVGYNQGSTVTNSYSTGNVTGYSDVGGLVGMVWSTTASNSFWDVQNSGQTTSAGGTGKTTAEMHDIATFVGAVWDIIAVAHEETNPAYTWNIVDGETYPFLSWEVWAKA